MELTNPRHFPSPIYSMEKGVANALFPAPEAFRNWTRGTIVIRPCNTLDMEAIFPIKDAASAALMAIKADYLHKAGLISEREKQWVDSRVRKFLDHAKLKDVAWSHPTCKSNAATPLSAGLVTSGLRVAILAAATCDTDVT